MDENEYTLNADYFKDVAKMTVAALAVVIAGGVALAAIEDKIVSNRINRKAKKNSKKN